METAVTGGTVIEIAEPQRWTMRASSIPETVSKLSEIWGTVANQVEEGSLPDSQVLALREDAHLRAEHAQGSEGDAHGAGATVGERDGVGRQRIRDVHTAGANACATAEQRARQRQLRVQKWTRATTKALGGRIVHDTGQGRGAFITVQFPELLSSELGGRTTIHLAFDKETRAQLHGSI